MMTRAQYDVMTDQQRLDYIQLLESMIEGDDEATQPLEAELSPDDPMIYPPLWMD